MERALVNLTAATVAFSLLFLLSQSNPPTSPPPSPPPLLLPPPHRGARPSMILPLFPSPKNPSSSFQNTRRHLLRSDSKSSNPNARMRLYDDLLLNGYYTTRLWIGTPPQRFALIVDTGSTVTYVPCATCEQCGRHQDPKFQPESSSTYQSVKCNSDCNCDKSRVQCIYERQYAEMSSSRGVLGEDILSFGNQSELVPQRAVFGCENEETGDLYSQRADGIMGLGRGDLSVVDQLVEKGVISDSFSLCYGGMDIGGGAMVLGGISAPSDMVFTHSDPFRDGNSPYYNIDLKEIHVAGKQLPLDPSIFDEKHGTVLDSGTTYAYLPEAAFVAFKNAIIKELDSLKQIRGPDPNYIDICFSSGSSNVNVSELSKIFPTVELVFGDQKKLLLSPENYLFRHSKVRGSYCLGIFQNEKDPTTLLGGIIVRNTLVTYDREHSKIGFWKTNCSELWERLHRTGGQSPSSSSSGMDNSTVESPTTSAAGGSSRYALPGEIQIGEIRLDVSLSINNSYLKPRINKLTDFIAVRLLNFTSEGNSSLVRWAIVPSESSTYISNVTAISIISLLAEHRVKFPVTFGSYKLVQWKVKPNSQQPWRQKHYLTVILSIIIVIIVGLSASGVWVIWRHRQRNINSYKLVHVAVPEQELQPLES
ncbi:aspartic proteinase-like protein 2 isoform X1 [Gossypium australe]|uniref:Aspartic proteinase-like protein 2 isoform X1 n=1 Tax=Gossypium australe TaxID=47621 RepID=A0A5B6UMP5_9ROSI|nr:aspartic proteinase-like protein 2 isoform X1 [Gossypium australe]